MKIKSKNCFLKQIAVLFLAIICFFSLKSMLIKKVGGPSKDVIKQESKILLDSLTGVGSNNYGSINPNYYNNFMLKNISPSLTKNASFKFSTHNQEHMTLAERKSAQAKDDYLENLNKELDPLTSAEEKYVLQVRRGEFVKNPLKDLTQEHIDEIKKAFESALEGLEDVEAVEPAYMKKNRFKKYAKTALGVIGGLGMLGALFGQDEQEEGGVKEKVAEEKEAVGEVKKDGNVKKKQEDKKSELQGSGNVKNNTEKEDIKKNEKSENDIKEPVKNNEIKNDEKEQNDKKEQEKSLKNTFNNVDKAVGKGIVNTVKAVANVTEATINAPSTLQGMIKNKINRAVEEKYKTQLAELQQIRAAEERRKEQERTDLLSLTLDQRVRRELVSELQKNNWGREEKTKVEKAKEFMTNLYNKYFGQGSKEDDLTKGHEGDLERRLYDDLVKGVVRSKDNLQAIKIEPHRRKQYLVEEKKRLDKEENRLKAEEGRLKTLLQEKKSEYDKAIFHDKKYINAKKEYDDLLEKINALKNIWKNQHDETFEKAYQDAMQETQGLLNISRIKVDNFLQQHEGMFLKSKQYSKYEQELKKYNEAKTEHENDSKNYQQYKNYEQTDKVRTFFKEQLKIQPLRIAESEFIAQQLHSEREQLKKVEEEMNIKINNINNNKSIAPEKKKEFYEEQVQPFLEMREKKLFEIEQESAVLIRQLSYHYGNLQKIGQAISGEISNMGWQRIDLEEQEKFRKEIGKPFWDTQQEKLSKITEVYNTMHGYIDKEKKSIQEVENILKLERGKMLVGAERDDWQKYNKKLYDNEIEIQDFLQRVKKEIDLLRQSPLFLELEKKKKDSIDLLKEKMPQGKEPDSQILKSIEEGFDNQKRELIEEKLQQYGKEFNKITNDHTKSLGDNLNENIINMFIERGYHKLKLPESILQLGNNLVKAPFLKQFSNIQELDKYMKHRQILNQYEMEWQEKQDYYNKELKKSVKRYNKAIKPDDKLALLAYVNDLNSRKNKAEEGLLGKLRSEYNMIANYTLNNQITDFEEMKKIMKHYGKTVDIESEPQQLPGYNKLIGQPAELPKIDEYEKAVAEYRKLAVQERRVQNIIGKMMPNSTFKEKQNKEKEYWDTQVPLTNEKEKALSKVTQLYNAENNIKKSSKEIENMLIQEESKLTGMKNMAQGVLNLKSNLPTIDPKNKSIIDKKQDEEIKKLFHQYESEVKQVEEKYQEDIRKNKNEVTNTGVDNFINNLKAWGIEETVWKQKIENEKNTKYSSDYQTYKKKIAEQNATLINEQGKLIAKSVKNLENSRQEKLLHELMVLAIIKDQEDDKQNIQRFNANKIHIEQEKQANEEKLLKSFMGQYNQISGKTVQNIEDMQQVINNYIKRPQILSPNNLVQQKKKNIPQLDENQERDIETLFNLYEDAVKKVNDNLVVNENVNNIINFLETEKVDSKNAQEYVQNKKNNNKQKLLEAVMEPYNKIIDQPISNKLQKNYQPITDVKQMEQIINEFQKQQVQQQIPLQQQLKNPLFFPPGVHSHNFIPKKLKEMAQKQQAQQREKRKNIYVGGYSLHELEEKKAKFPPQQQQHNQNVTQQIKPQAQQNQQNLNKLNQVRGVNINKLQKIIDNDYAKESN